MFHAGRLMDGQMDVGKLIVALLNFVKEPQGYMTHCLVRL
jgi:hypothetical protein